MRINKYLSGCGIDSRRKCEQLVLDGRVRVNGKTVSALSTDVKDGDYVEVDGKAVAGDRVPLFADAKEHHIAVFLE